MKYAEVQTCPGVPPMLVSFNNQEERDKAAANFDGAYFFDMSYTKARKSYDLRRYYNPRYLKLIEIGGEKFEAILKKEDALHEEIAMAMTPQKVHEDLRDRLQLMLLLLDEEEETS